MVRKNTWGLVLTFAFLSIGISAAGFYLYITEEEINKKDFEKKLTAVSNLKTAQLTKWKTEKIFDADILRSNPLVRNEIYDFINNVSLKSKRNIDDIFKSYVRFGEYTDAFILGPTKEVKYSTGSLGYNPSELDSFFYQPFPKLKDFFRSDYDNKIYLDIVIPFLNNEQTFAAVILRIDPNKYLFPIIQQWPTPNKTAETLIFRKEGDSLVYLNELKHKKNTALNLRFKIDKKELPAAIGIREGRYGIIEGTDYRGMKVLAHVSEIPDLPWFLLSKQDLAEIYEPTAKLASLVSAVILVLVLSAGLFLGFLWIKNMKKAEDEIKRSQTHFQKLIENAPDGITLISKEGRMLYHSPSAMKLFGYNQEESLDINPNELTHPDDLPSVLNTLVNLSSIPSGTINIQYRFKHKNGSWRWIESTFTDLLDEPSVNAIVINFRDITEKKLAKEAIDKLNDELEKKVAERTIQLQEANIELEAFSYSVSHDLRSPLRAISGFTKILMEDYYDNLEEDMKDILQDILQNANDMSHLIDDLLEFSRLSRREVNQSSIDMTRLFKQSFDEFRKLEPERNIQLLINKLPPAYGDYTLIKQVVRNLISNAIKFTSQKPAAVITVEGNENNEKNLYTVKDNGVGFNMKYVDKIFGVFQRLHSTSEFEGTGVGLAIVHRIIDRHGGKIWAESESNKGAAFYFTLLNGRGEN